MAGPIKRLQNFRRNLCEFGGDCLFLLGVLLIVLGEPVLRLVRHRMWPWSLIAVGLLIWNAELQPDHLRELLYKLNNAAIAAVMAYWVDRGLAPYARPDKFLAEATGEGKPPGDISQAVFFAAAQLRRAIVFGAVMAGITLGI